ncbi:MAG: hypothetical protein ACYDA2_08925 [Acidimicrobiales bacterium]
MMRRGIWFAAGIAAGAGATVWTRRRVEAIAQQARDGRLPAEVVRLADRGSRRVGRHLAGAVEAGRLQARRREVQLRTTLAPRTQAR